MLEYVTAGSSDLKPMVFIHGWPDTAALWHSQMSYFSSRYQCYALTLPAFGSNDAQALQQPHGFADLRDQIIETLTQLLAASPFDSVVLVGHDWGAVLSYLIEEKRPDLVSQLITLDVGAYMRPTSLGHAAFIAAYQGWLIGAYGVNQINSKLGDAMTRWFAKIARAPHAASAHAGMNYIYLELWWHSLRETNPLINFAGMRRYEPQCPLLYLYGSRKPYHFHSQEWLDAVPTFKFGRVEGFPGGHWFFVKHAKETNAAIDAWLAWLESLDHEYTVSNNSPNATNAEKSDIVLPNS